MTDGQTELHQSISRVAFMHECGLDRDKNLAGRPLIY